MSTTSSPPPVGRLLKALVEGGMVDGGAALAGSVTVVDRSHSNPVSVVEVDGRARLVVKQAEFTFDRIDPFEAEAAAYRWLAATPGAAAVAPALVAELGALRAVVLSALEGAVPLHMALLGSTAPVTERVLARLGHALGVVHAGRPAGLCGRRPWILDVPSGGLPAPLAQDEVVRAVAGRIVEPGPLALAVEEAARRWTPRTPMHGDVKFDNVLVLPGGGGVWLVDWELAGLGEPAWDLAGVLDGIVRPRLVLGQEALGPDVAAQADLVMAAHRAVVGAGLVPTAAELWLATVTRLAQSAIQLAAMRHGDPDCAAQALQVVDGAAALAADVGGWSAFAAGATRAA